MTGRAGARPAAVLDLAIIGDGPAGLALGAAARERGLRVGVIGSGAPWPATYGLWRDEVPGLPDECFTAVVPHVVVHGHRRHVLERPYGVLANDAARAHFGRDVELIPARAERTVRTPTAVRVLTDAGRVDARIVVDAGGRSLVPGQAAQSAYGVVVTDPPPGALEPTLMDLRPAGEGVPTFCYVVPTAAGWLVEETVLVARPPIGPDALAPRLAARLGGAVPAGGIERVLIPVGGPLPGATGPVVPFGAAAGYTHPATGFSVAASLRAAPRVADAIAAVCARTGRPDPGPVHAAVWPRRLRATRRLHDYGMAVVAGLEQDALAAFFDAFFELPVARWAPYLRIDADPLEVSRTMWLLARRLPPGLRRRLLVRPPAGAS